MYLMALHVVWTRTSQFPRRLYSQDWASRFTDSYNSLQPQLGLGLVWGKRGAWGGTAEVLTNHQKEYARPVGRCKPVALALGVRSCLKDQTKSRLPILTGAELRNLAFIVVVADRAPPFTPVGLELTEVHLPCLLTSGTKGVCHPCWAHSTPLSWKECLCGTPQCRGIPPTKR